MDKSQTSHNFVQEWLNHFNLEYRKNVEINSRLTMDFHVSQYSIGVYIVDWKKPISVQVVNRAIQIQRELNLEILYLIANEISNPAKETLEKFGQNIISLHPNGLSDLAVNLANSIQTKTNKVPANL